MYVYVCYTTSHYGPIHELTFLLLIYQDIISSLGDNVDTIWKKVLCQSGSASVTTTQLCRSCKVSFSFTQDPHQYTSPDTVLLLLVQTYMAKAKRICEKNQKELQLTQYRNRKQNIHGIKNPCYSWKTIVDHDYWPENVDKLSMYEYSLFTK